MKNAICQAVHKQKLFEVAKQSVFWLLTLSVIFLPKISQSVHVCESRSNPNVGRFLETRSRFDLTLGSPGSNPDWKHCDPGCKDSPKCSWGRHLACSWHIRRLNLQPQNPTPAPEISQIEPCKHTKARVKTSTATPSCSVSEVNMARYDRVFWAVPLYFTHCDSAASVRIGALYVQ